MSAHEGNSDQEMPAYAARVWTAARRSVRLAKVHTRATLRGSWASMIAKSSATGGLREQLFQALGDFDRLYGGKICYGTPCYSMTRCSHLGAVILAIRDRDGWGIQGPRYHG